MAWAHSAAASARSASPSGPEPSTFSALPKGVSASARESFASSAATPTFSTWFHPLRRAAAASVTIFWVMATRSGRRAERDTASYAASGPPAAPDDAVAVAREAEGGTDAGGNDAGRAASSAVAGGTEGCFARSASGRLSVSVSAMVSAINRLPERLLRDHYSKIWPGSSESDSGRWCRRRA